MIVDGDTKVLVNFGERPFACSPAEWSTQPPTVTQAHQSGSRDISDGSGGGGVLLPVSAWALMRREGGVLDAGPTLPRCGADGPNAVFDREAQCFK